MKVDELIRTLAKPRSARLPIPHYSGSSSQGIALAVESMSRHTTAEGWQIMQGLEHAGYQLCGHDLPINETCVSCILGKVSPGVVLVQDKREWDVSEKNFRDKRARFHNVSILASRPDLFKLTILKDSHQRADYHRESASEMGVNAWVIYYHPRMVTHLAPYVRPQHLIRTYHSLNPALVPAYSPNNRRGALLSGAMSGAYPFRQFLKKKLGRLPQVEYLAHPGYHRNGCATRDYLMKLSKYKVAICTSSIYGYALRKMIEATACGCVVLTNLPEDEVLPGIDENLVRIPDTKNILEVAQVLQGIYSAYNPERQQELATKAKQFYDYRVLGTKLAQDIENLRRQYGVRK